MNISRKEVATTKKKKKKANVRDGRTPKGQKKKHYTNSEVYGALLIMKQICITYLQIRVDNALRG